MGFNSGFKGLRTTGVTWSQIVQDGLQWRTLWSGHWRFR